MTDAAYLCQMFVDILCHYFVFILESLECNIQIVKFNFLKMKINWLLDLN